MGVALPLCWGGVNIKIACILLVSFLENRVHGLHFWDKFLFTVLFNKIILNFLFIFMSVGILPAWIPYTPVTNSAYRGQERTSNPMGLKYRWFWATPWVLGTEPRTSGSAARPFNGSATSAAQTMFPHPRIPWLSEVYYTPCHSHQISLPKSWGDCLVSETAWFTSMRTPLWIQHPYKKLGMTSCACDLSIQGWRQVDPEGSGSAA